MLRISEADYCAMRAHAEQAYPRECCGVLLGRPRDGMNVVVEIRQTKNACEGAVNTRYQIAPEDLVAMQKQARERNLEIIGFYHSHPDHSSRWSETDLAEAHWLGCSYVITAVAEGVAQATNSFRLAGRTEEDKQFVDEEIEIVP
jgi:proteasome lid subunit RPN8/RPN11